MDKAQEVYLKLMNDFGFKDATGEITFTLKDIAIVVNQNNRYLVHSRISSHF